MKKISVFDTTISDYNLGNEIIMDSVYRHLREIFPEDFFFKLPYMEITSHTLWYIQQSNLIFFGGTNSLSSRMERYKQWGLSLLNFFRIRNVILMGIGWWQYQDIQISLYTKMMLKTSLSHDFFHAVRDSYTEEKLKQIGFTNILNTGCPTLWDFSPGFCEMIKTTKSDKVIFTLTDYNKDIERDKKMVEILEKNYNKIYFWVQGSGDLLYLNDEIRPAKNIEIISPNLKKYDEVLHSFDVDYVGTRLHAGIRALQFKRRSIIIGVDNRAIEMQKDFDLPVLKREEIEHLDTLINTDMAVSIKLPLKNIAKWKQQFKIYE